MASPVLVTGATGTLGRKLLARLVAAALGVWALSRRPPPGSDADVDRVIADLHDPDELGTAVAGSDLVVHCAWSPRGDTTEP